MTRDEFLSAWGHVELAEETYELLVDAGATANDFAKALEALERKVGNAWKGYMRSEWGYFRATVTNLVAQRRKILKDAGAAAA